MWRRTCSTKYDVLSISHDRIDYYEMGAVIDCAGANVEEDMQYDVLSISHDRIDYYELKNNGVCFKDKIDYARTCI